MFCRQQVVIITTFFARTIVTFFAIIFEAEFWQIVIAKHCYILAIENSAKPFPLKTIKIYRHKLKIIFSVTRP
jgi:hypothetical protein